MSIDLLSLSGALKGERALADLLAASTMEGDDAELCLNARKVDSIDAVGATATRMRIERHLREHPAGRVQIWQPTQAAVAARLHDILDPLPPRVGIGDVPGAVAPAHFTLLPATPIADSEGARLIGEVVWDGCREARIARRRAVYIAEATTELTDNALRHAPGPPDRPVVAVSSFARERIVEVAVTDAGTEISEGEDPGAILRAIPGRALQGEGGFLGLIINKGLAAGVDVQVRILAGTGRLLWERTQHRVERGLYVPGTTVVARIAP
jgi:anti-sigma regulatory factor (Ser/Thr protein kinase)